MTQLANKTILITGAAGGFGRQFMRQLLALNCRLIVTDLNAVTLQEITQRIHAEVGRGEIVAAIGSDLSSADGANALFAAVQEPVDVLINNAGLAVVGRHDEVPQTAWERLLQVNLLAPMRLCALFTPQMIARQSGHIVNIASLAAWTPDVGLSAYSASKFGLRGFSEALATELTPHHVEVSAVYPFYSNTAIIDSPRYGSIGAMNSAETVDRSSLTDPADVVRATLAAVESNTRHIFPDKTARTIYRLKRYTPILFAFLQKRFSRTQSE
jgi:short-subunit dehydrogenase